MDGELERKLWNEVAVRFRERHAAWVAAQERTSSGGAVSSRLPYDTVEVIRAAIEDALHAHPELREIFDAAYTAAKSKTYRPPADPPGSPRFFFEQYLDKLAVMRDEGLDLGTRALPVFREYILSDAEWYPRLSGFLQFLPARQEAFVEFVRACLALREEFGKDARNNRGYLQRRNALFKKFFASEVDQTSSSAFIVALESDVEHLEHDDRRMFLDCLEAVVGRDRYSSELPTRLRSRIEALRRTADTLLEHIEQVTTDALDLPQQRTFVPLQPELIVFKPVEFDVRQRAQLARYRLDNPLMYLMLALIGCPVAWMVFKIFPAAGAWAVPIAWRAASVVPLGPLAILMQTKLGIPAPDSRLLAAGLLFSMAIAAMIYLVRLPYTIVQVVRKRKVFAELRRRNEAEKRRVDALNAEAIARVQALNEERRREIETHNAQVESRAPIIERIRAAYQDFARRKPGMVDEINALIGELDALRSLADTTTDPASVAGAQVRLNACASRLTITADRARALLRTLTDEMGVPADPPQRPRSVERRKDDGRASS